MNDLFTKRLKAATLAGWWVFLLAWVLVLLQWLIYLPMMKAKPGWFLAVWGEGATWPQIQDIWLRTIIDFKLLVWMLALLLVWLSLWSRQLKKIS